MVYAWDMKGHKPLFTLKAKELNGLELPKGTVLEVEFVHELQGEVRLLIKHLLYVQARVFQLVANLSLMNHTYSL